MNEQKHAFNVRKVHLMSKSTKVLTINMADKLFRTHFLDLVAHNAGISNSNAACDSYSQYS